MEVAIRFMFSSFLIFLVFMALIVIMEAYVDKQLLKRKKNSIKRVQNGKKIVYITVTEKSRDVNVA